MKRVRDTFVCEREICSCVTHQEVMCHIYLLYVPVMSERESEREREGEREKE